MMWFQNLNFLADDFVNTNLFTQSLNNNKINFADHFKIIKLSYLLEVYFGFINSKKKQFRY